MLSAVVIATLIAAASAQDCAENDFQCHVNKILGQFGDSTKDNQDSLSNLLGGLDLSKLLMGVDVNKLLMGVDLEGLDLNNIDLSQFDLSKLNLGELTNKLQGQDLTQAEGFCKQQCAKLDGTQFASHKAACEAGCDQISSVSDIFTKQAEDAKPILADLRKQLKGLMDEGKLGQLQTDFQKFAGQFLAGHQFSDEQKALAQKFGVDIEKLRSQAIGLLNANADPNADPNALANAAATLRNSLLGAVGNNDELVAKVQKQLAALNLADDQQAIVIQIANAVDASLVDVRDAVSQYGGVIDQIDQLLGRRKRQEAEPAEPAVERHNYVIVAPMPRIGTDLSIADISDLLATVDGDVKVLGVVTPGQVQQLGVLNQQVFEEQNKPEDSQDAASAVALASAMVVGLIATLMY